MVWPSSSKSFTIDLRYKILYLLWGIGGGKLVFVRIYNKFGDELLTYLEKIHISRARP
jgi:hypothetical protein